MKKTLAVAALTLPLSALAAGVDLAASRLEFTLKQMGVPMRGSFTRFSADAHFDPAALSRSRAEIRIPLTSVNLPTPDAEAEVKKPDWFDVARYPEARFVASRFARLADGRYQVQGRLTLKGVSRELAAPFTVRAQGRGYLIEGVLPISRLAFGIGDGSWRDTETVADTVQLKFRLALTGQ